MAYVKHDFIYDSVPYLLNNLFSQKKNEFYIIELYNHIARFTPYLCKEIFVRYQDLSRTEQVKINLIVLKFVEMYTKTYNLHFSSSKIDSENFKITLSNNIILISNAAIVVKKERNTKTIKLLGNSYRPIIKYFSC